MDRKSFCFVILSCSLAVIDIIDKNISSILIVVLLVVGGGGVMVSMEDCPACSRFLCTTGIERTPIIAVNASGTHGTIVIA